MAASVLIGSARPSDQGPLEAALRRKGIRASVFSEGNRMVEAANYAGGADNITVVIVQVSR